VASNHDKLGHVRHLVVEVKLLNQFPTSVPDFSPKLNRRIVSLASVATYDGIHALASVATYGGIHALASVATGNGEY
ncbi:MAG: hypothetical protein NXI32_29070, partial [bacterium]|nr:hypothetical protein [bacterium]